MSAPNPIHSSAPLPTAEAAASGQPADAAAVTAEQSSGLPLSEKAAAILARAEAILRQEAISDGERRVRIEIIRAALTGTVIRPSDDSPEMRNPAYWLLKHDRFVLAPGVSPVEAIEDLWVLHGADGIPVPRIRCLKYTTLILIKGIIQHLRATGNDTGIQALNEFLERRVIPEELPNKGYDILWKRHFDADRLLPGDQVWFDNPFFDRGRELFRERFQQQAMHAGKPEDEAMEWARLRAKAMTAGEEGSNAFYVGDDHFLLGADSLVRSFRGTLRDHDAAGQLPPHEQVFTQKLFSLKSFREHMMEDNFSVQACLRAGSDAVHPDCFTIERVRAPLDPEHFLHYHAQHPRDAAFDDLIDALASANPPPALKQHGQTTQPVFATTYNWDEQERVRLAVDAVMQADPDAIWWTLREHIDDDRYVLTARRGNTTQNFTVGMICSDLADARLCLCFTRRLPLVPGRLPDSFRPEREFLANEHEWRAVGMPLFAMQAALCEVAIRDWETVLETQPGEDGRHHRFSPEEKNRYIRALQAEIDERTRTRQAACEEVILPCLPAPTGWEGFDAETASGFGNEPELRRQ